MRNIEFYKTIKGNCPVEDYLDTLSDKFVEKILWVIRLVKELQIVPKKYFKKLVNTDGIFEIRIQSGNNIFRLLGFFYKDSVIILTNGFTKKRQKTPKNEITLAEDRKKDFLERKKDKNG